MGAGNGGSPVICGFNTGQHMFLDAPSGGACITGNFLFGTDSYSRKIDIKILQYQCGAEMGGPQECLQYFTAESGKVASYGFPTTSSDVSATTTHLADQFYTICWRRGSGKCGLCFWPSITSGTQNSFGLGISNTDPAAQSYTSGPCDEDFITIPFATADPSTIIAGQSAQGTADRHCGRFLRRQIQKLQQPQFALVSDRSK